MLNTKKPDFIYDYENNILGVKNEEGDLEIYGNHVTPFVQNYWSNWFGQKSARIFPIAQKTYGNNFTLTINDREDECMESDIQINISNAALQRLLNLIKNH